jgi:hypothetical protein
MSASPDGGGARGAPEDVAPAVRRLLRSWRPIDIPEISASPEGLAEISRVLLMLAVRNQMFIKAMGVEGFVRDAAELRDFVDAHEALLCNLALLRNSHVGLLEISEVVESARAASIDLADRRSRVLVRLPAETARRVTDVEWQVRVSTDEIRADIDRAQSLIDAVADVAMSADWLSSSLPSKVPSAD